MYRKWSKKSLALFGCLFLLNSVYDLNGQDQLTIGVFAGSNLNSINISELDKENPSTKGDMGITLGLLVNQTIPLKSGLEFLKFEGVLAFRQNRIPTNLDSLTVIAKNNKIEFKPIFSFDIGKKVIRPRLSVGVDVGLKMPKKIDDTDYQLRSLKSIFSSQAIFGLGLNFYSKVFLYARLQFRIIPFQEKKSLEQNNTLTTIEWNPAEISFGIAYLFLN